MSKYTTELRFICETSAGLDESVGLNNVAEVIEQSRDKIFDFNFPIFDESYRSVLETKIIRHFYTREICTETVGLWKMWLNTRMNEIMPYYNKLYESELIKFNPMYDVDLTTDYQKTNEGTKDETGTHGLTDVYSENGTESVNDVKALNETSVENGGGNGVSTDSGSDTKNDALKNDHWDYYSDTPQGGINGVANMEYLTNARHITDDGTGSTSTSEYDKTNNTSYTNENTVNKNGDVNETINKENTKNSNLNRNENNTNNSRMTGLEDYVQHVVGKSVGISYSKLLNEFRDTFLNIDMMIINDLSDLFFNLW